MDQVISTIAVVASVLVFAYQARELAIQSRVANQVAGTQAHRELIGYYQPVYDVFIQFPDLHAHYFDATQASPSAHDTVRLQMLAEMHADFLSMGAHTSQALKSYTPWADEWVHYISGALASSSRLRKEIRSDPTLYPALQPLLAAYDASVESESAG